MYQDELEKLSKENNHIGVIYRFGRPTKQFLKKFLNRYMDADFFIAGPPQMVVDTQALLFQIGISEKNITLEEFSGYDDDFGDPSDRLLFGKKGELSERPLADLEALLQALSTSGLVSETNAQGTITYANDKFIEISKYSRAELIGQNHRILKSGLHPPSFYENLWATITRGRVWRGEIKNRAKDGSYYWVDTSIAPIVGKDGKPIKYISVRFPVTERRQAEEEVRERAKQQTVITALSQQALASTNLQSLAKERAFTRSYINFLQAVANLLANAERQQLERRKDEFISTASHELKTPLTSIKDFIQILQKRFERLKGKREKDTYTFLSKIDNQLIKLTNLIGDLLDITKIQSGKLQYNDELFLLDELISETTDDLQLISRTHTIAYKGKGTYAVLADKYRIGQVLTNLIHNAVKYSPHATKVIVSGITDGKNITISVKDFGIGISREDQSHIFERFFQGEDKKRLQIPGGLGLGLFISSEIIKRYHGHIWVKSEKGKGSTFSFSLPLMKS